MILHSKVTEEGGGGGGNMGVIGEYSFREKTSLNSEARKLYESVLAIYVFPDGSVNVSKNRYGDVGELTLEGAIIYFSDILANLKLADTDIRLFKSGLSTILQEEISQVLKGEHYERAICSKSAGHGSPTNRST